ncbi:hypothetical protein Scep_014755 [Stephania cephalantha]|uniref:Uncharacterized protein n=1 Tax=Stephania cephalantha TaxID=152367 RepID=A0AAP0J1V1_9MAGN
MIASKSFIENSGEECDPLKAAAIAEGRALETLLFSIEVQVAGLLCLAQPEVKQIVVSRTTRGQTDCCVSHNQKTNRIVVSCTTEVNRLNKSEACYVGPAATCDEGEQRGESGTGASPITVSWRQR